MKNENYFVQRDEDNILKIRQLIEELPSFCDEFFLGIEAYTSSLTRLGYARDLKIFFYFLTHSCAEYKMLSMREFSISDLDTVTATHIE